MKRLIDRGNSSLLIEMSGMIGNVLNEDAAVLEIQQEKGAAENPHPASEKKPQRSVHGSVKNARKWVSAHWVWILVGVTALVFIPALIAVIVIVVTQHQQTSYCLQTTKGVTGLSAVSLGSDVCNREEYTSLDLSSLSSLRTVTIGDRDFMHVNTVTISNLLLLESVVIGENSFTENRDGHKNNANRRFTLKNCPSLRELKIGRYSFSDYTVCEITNMIGLEVIEIGDLANENDSDVFFYASLELKGA